jgi:hypothetical protein
MKESTKSFIKDVVLTTGIAFFLISFLFLGLYAMRGYGGPTTTLFQCFGYIFIKLYLGVFPFSLSLGFINRIFMLKKNRAVLRFWHFVLSFLAFLIFMVFLFNLNLSAGFEEAEVTTASVITQALTFVFLYPVVIGLRRLGCAIFRVKDTKTPYKSILD